MFGLLFSFVIQVKRYKTVDGYNDALGFVTQVTLERWTDQDWIDNGTWLSHMLGSPEEPVMPGYYDMRNAGILGAGPSLDAIYNKYGSLANYQKALGFTPRERQLPYPEWDRDTFVRNGVWLSHALGTPEHPKMPTESDIARGAELGLCPPLHALTKRFKRSFATYQDAIGFVTKATLERWTDQDWIDNGTWLSHMLGSPEEPKLPLASDFREASPVYITPSEDRIIAKYGSVVAYQIGLGFEPKYASRLLTARDILAMSSDLMGELGRVPKAADYRAHGISLDAIRSRFGGTVQMHEILGVENHKGSNPAKHLATGVRWAIERGDHIPSPRDINRWHREGRGPHLSRIYKDFGTHTQYAEQVRQAVVAYHELKADLSDTLNRGPKAIPRLLREFSPSKEYRKDRLDLATRLQTLVLNDKGSINRLEKIFARSRLTLSWMPDDFIYFGKAALGHYNLELNDCRKKLHLVQRAELAPYPHDIPEVFGSEDNFIDVMRTELGVAA